MLFFPSGAVKHFGKLFVIFIFEKTLEVSKIKVFHRFHIPTPVSIFKKSLKNG